MMAGPESQGARLTVMGVFFSLLLVAALVGGGVYLAFFQNKTGTVPTGGPGMTTPMGKPGAPAAGPTAATPGPAAFQAEGLTEAMTEVPRLDPPGAYEPQGNVVNIELSEYAGYAGLIVANGGLDPNPNSIFAQKYGFQVRIKLSEEESWSALNAGKMAASATTADVLAVYGRQFEVVVPLQLGFSRGADGVVVRSDIKRINHLKGKTIVTSQFTESDFFIRYLAQEAGIDVKALTGPGEKPDGESINVLYAEDSFKAGDIFLQDVKDGTNRLAGCITWEPKTSEVAKAAGNQAKVLVTNRNLLIVADILVVNKAFAQKHPDMVAGLVQGALEGNRMVRENGAGHLDTIARAFKWDREKAKAELAKVHLSNLPENLAFFNGSIDSAGSFGGIYHAAVYAYGPALIPNPTDPERFADLSFLQAIHQSGAFADQTILIAPIRSASGQALEVNPLLSKDIRFFFLPNSSTLDLSNQDNQKNMDAIKSLLQVSPGSRVLLRGHVDNARVGEFRKAGGEELVRKMALEAMELSKKRAAEVRQQLLTKHKLDAARLEIVGRGWDEPVSQDGNLNRRVEVQWFTLE